jgi:hypothetical protein
MPRRSNSTPLLASSSRVVTPAVMRCASETRSIPEKSLSEKIESKLKSLPPSRSSAARLVAVGRVDVQHPRLQRLAQRAAEGHRVGRSNSSAAVHAEGRDHARGAARPSLIGCVGVVAGGIEQDSRGTTHQPGSRQGRPASLGVQPRPVAAGCRGGSQRCPAAELVELGLEAVFAARPSTPEACAAELRARS